MDTFTKKEMTFIIGISSALGLRQLGLMLVLPFISLYGKTLWGSSPALIGLALGIYGLAQGCLQIPYGMLSDRIGRKKIVLIGLIQLIAGLVIAFFATNIYTFLIARALQGSGAINAAALSWVGDNIERTKSDRAMGIISATCGAASALAIAGGSLLQNVLTIPQIFMLCAILTFSAWLYIFMQLKEDRQMPHRISATDDSGKQKPLLRNNLMSGNMLFLLVMGFILNYLLMSIFFITPGILEGIAGRNGMWKIYIPAVIAGIIVIRVANVLIQKGKGIIIMPAAFLCLLSGALCLLKPEGIIVTLGTIVFFAGFVCLNAQITSGVNLEADAKNRGAIQGISNTTQFIGSFLGGSLTGILWGINQGIAIWSAIIVCIAGVILSYRYTLAQTAKAHMEENDDTSNTEIV